MKPFKCTIEIPNAETAAYIRALIQGAALGDRHFEMSAREKIGKFFPGGVVAADRLGLTLEGERHTIWQTLSDALYAAGISNTSAPWLEPQAPLCIDGNEVTYHPQGIKVGGARIDLDAMRAMVEKCEGMT